MRQKTEKSLLKITIIIVYLLGMILLLAQCREKPSSETSALATTEFEDATPFLSVTQISITTVEGTEDIQSSVTSTPAPVPVMTEKESNVLNAMAQTDINTTSTEDCDVVLEDSPWCGVVSSAWQVTRPEWEDLFPQADFYVVRRTLFGNEFPEQRNILVIEQGGHNLSLDTGKAFEQLIETNNVVITEENQEIVGQALVLMYLPDYLEGEIEFSDWRGGNWPAPGRGDYNYAVNVQTDIKKWQLSWFFWFYEGQLITAQGRVVLNEEIGLQRDGLNPPPDDILTYWRK